MELEGAEEGRGKKRRFREVAGTAVPGVECSRLEYRPALVRQFLSNPYRQPIGSGLGCLKRAVPRCPGPGRGLGRPAERKARGPETGQEAGG